MQNYGKNYVEIETRSPLNTGFLYFDSQDFVADQIFVNSELRVKFYKDGYKDGNEFVACMVKVRRKNREKFVACMDELRTKMLVLYGDEYDQVCDDMIGKIRAKMD